jgi:hypothetical protein
VCHKPNLELTTKARVCKVASQEGSPGMKASVKEWTFRLLRELPLWEFGVPLDSQIFKEQLQGSNLMDWTFLYTIGKLLQRRCLKWACMTHLDIWNTSYGQKKGWESNCQFDSRPLKVKNHPDFFAWRWRVTYCWKNSRQGLQLCFRPHLHRRSACKVMAPPKVTGILVVGISGLPLGSHGTKCHLDVGLVERHKVYYNGKVVASPKSRPC